MSLLLSFVSNNSAEANNNLATQSEVARISMQSENPHIANLASDYIKGLCNNNTHSGNIQNKDLHENLLPKEENGTNFKIEKIQFI